MVDLNHLATIMLAHGVIHDDFQLNCTLPTSPTDFHARFVFAIFAYVIEVGMDNEQNIHDLINYTYN